MNAPAKFVGNRYTKITWQPKRHHDITMEAFHSPCIHATLLDHTGAAFARKQNCEEYEKAGKEGLAARLLTCTESAPAFPQAPRSQPRERPNSIVSNFKTCSNAAASAAAICDQTGPKFVPCSGT